MKYFLLILSYFLITNICFANQSNVNFGLVKQGSFLLNKTPNTLRDGLWVHGLIGYLPTGTRVIIKDKQDVTNLRTSDNETYYFVKSEFGIQGLLREDLLIKANGRKLAVSIASYPIQIHQSVATLQNPHKRFTLGRHGGDYLEITGESEEGFYDVILHRAIYKSIGLPETEKARLKKLYVNQNQVALLDPSEKSLKKEFDSTWSSIVGADDDSFKKIINKIKDKIGTDFDKIKSIITNINDLQCLLCGSFNGELGYKVFSNGFSLKLDAELKKKRDKMYM